MKRFKAIACVDQNWAIGKDNKLLFHIPEDINFFKKMTTNNVVIMGNNTFKSMNENPLSDRTNIVITRKAKNGILRNSGSTIIKATPDNVNILLMSILTSTDKDIFIIGGQKIYEIYADMCNDIYLTHVETTVDGADAFFPKNVILNNRYECETLSEHQYHDKYNNLYRFSIKHYYTD